MKLDWQTGDRSSKWKIDEQSHKNRSVTGWCKPSIIYGWLDSAEQVESVARCVPVCVCVRVCRTYYFDSRTFSKFPRSNSQDCRSMTRWHAWFRPSTHTLTHTRQLNIPQVCVRPVCVHGGNVWRSAGISAPVIATLVHCLLQHFLLFIFPLSLTNTRQAGLVKSDPFWSLFNRSTNFFITRTFLFFPSSNPTTLTACFGSNTWSYQLILKRWVVEHVKGYRLKKLALKSARKQAAYLTAKTTHFLQSETRPASWALWLGPRFDTHVSCPTWHIQHELPGLSTWPFAARWQHLKD